MRRQRGVVLVVVLVFALLLASTISTFLRRASIDHLVARNREETSRAESLARGGIRLAIAILLEDKLKEKQQVGFPGESLDDDWSLVGLAPIELDDGSSLRLRIEDVGSKLNLNSVLHFEDGGEPNERTEPLLNALLNCASGATWVSIHHGGGVGIGYSQHAGMVIVCDGSADAARRLERVLWNDPATGVMGHADAGYPEAIACAEENALDLPSLRKA